MTRTLRFMVAFLAIFATTSMSISAEAASKAEIKTAKTHVKVVSKELKTYNKLVSKWEKTTTKGKDTSKVEAKVLSMVKSQLSELAAKGVESTADKSEEGTDKWVERYRNTLVAVRDAKAEGRKRNQMKELVKFLEKRVERANKKLSKMGG